ncbi:YciI family protein [Glaciimonas sp. GG7]
MRFMVIVKADRNSEAGVLPDEELFIKMGKFNEELAKAGMLLAAEGLHASSKGARIALEKDAKPDAKPNVIDGPFTGTEARGLISGFWMIAAKSKEEAIAWFSRCPAEVGEIEIRQVCEAVDFDTVIKTEESAAAMEAEHALRKPPVSTSTANMHSPH